MSILIIGATGYIGSALTSELRRHDIEVLSASRSPVTDHAHHRQVDIMDLDSLSKAMRDIEVVINCVSGDALAISDGARNLVEAAIRSGVKKIVHMSSMAVYGFGNPCMDEHTQLNGGGNWYAEAKVRAESEIALFAQHGEVIIFRVGCVAGRGSMQWVQRIGDLLVARRIGDLGGLGDGWSNLVALDDVCQAVVQSVYRPESPEPLNIFNLAAPNSPRWNRYFVDFSQLIGAFPPHRISATNLKIETHLKAPVLVAYGKIRRAATFLPAWNEPAIPPSLTKLFRCAGKLDTSHIDKNFSINWTTYENMVREGASWYFDNKHGSSTA